MSNTTVLPSRPGAGTPGKEKDVPRRRPGPTVGKYISVGLLVLGAIGMIAPFLWMFTTSLRDASQAYDLPPQWLPTELDWSNYADAVSGPVPILKNMFNSAVIAIAVSIGMIITAPMAGYAFAKLEFPGRNSIFVGLLSSLMVPAQVTIIPLFLLMRAFGLLDNPLSLILPGITGALGVFLLRQFFLGLPQEIIDAARMDGATAWQTYRLIALPLAKNAVSTLGVITFLGSWNAYFAPSIFLNSTDTATLPLGLVLMLGPYGAGNVAQVMAATTIAIAPALIVFLVAQRWIIASLTQSAVKG
ncbi:multiple sugar transport system permease protein [Arthrobacter pascens]|uniref:carbohydrate ABC transporter permease n=1 Tax=Arthrobacter pascens TaxID=1677 RepID=UPI002794BA20|nr:carbohydrate ABC transporter permease [Arthrobacter pascens]MDQ0679815.1 multiple sugar transport system permease protein [Arthrobacter pascens]